MKFNIRVFAEQKIRFAAIALFIAVGAAVISSASDEIPPRLIATRVYGGNSELLPPIIRLSEPSRKPAMLQAFGENYATVELDVQAALPPQLYVQVVHCDVNWREDENIFLNNTAQSRTSNIEWRSAAVQSEYFTHRAIIALPNSQIKFSVGGNWKAKFYSYDDNSLFAEAKVFVIDPIGECRVDIYPDVYMPNVRAGGAAFAVEAAVRLNQRLSDFQLHTVTLYRNNRFAEPMPVSANSVVELNERMFRDNMPRSVYGFAGFGKKFRIEKVPAENGYRVLDAANTVIFPSGNYPVRLPMTDLRRNGTYSDMDSDGGFDTRFVSGGYDEYAAVEFVLDPEGPPSADAVFVSGSFNNWSPDAQWMMNYDTEKGLYFLRQWVRRGRHDYLYMTGRLNADTRRTDRRDYAEFEGNSNANNHSFIALAYYRETDGGGYDTIVACGAANQYGTIRR
ncbi:MAG: DUF5103 domain-containing protein [Bacteroidetes bacterium]|nr:DUF5103 domain-containing protein [Bacteroidota bacterium]MCZ2133668.1 DUF5103 domain-containing protein [Bacteroidota bacterium]